MFHYQGVGNKALSSQKLRESLLFASGSEANGETEGSIRVELKGDPWWVHSRRFGPSVVYVGTYIGYLDQFPVFKRNVRVTQHLTINDSFRNV